MENVAILRSAACEGVLVRMVWLPRRSSQLELNHTMLPYALLSSIVGLSPGYRATRRKPVFPADRASARYP
jgi:hypothetical protein